jgi:flagellar hook assembly protein FlgD
LHATPLQGKRRFVWDGRDDQGRQAGSGLYFVRVTLDSKAATRQFVKRVMMLK